jgi:hypothetical protein
MQKLNLMKCERHGSPALSPISQIDNIILNHFWGHVPEHNMGIAFLWVHQLDNVKVIASMHNVEILIHDKE